MSVEFCDTNIFVYAYDPTQGTRHDRAVQLVGGLWDSGEGAVSIQVLQELFVVLTRKVAGRLLPEVARRYVAGLTNWRLFAPHANEVLEAIDASVRWQVSFWDAMLIVASQKLGAAILWSEDLNAGQRFGEVEVRNPFR